MKTLEIFEVSINDTLDDTDLAGWFYWLSNGEEPVGPFASERKAQAAGIAAMHNLRFDQSPMGNNDNDVHAMDMA